jgi:hypothetical protein
LREKASDQMDKIQDLSIQTVWKNKKAPSHRTFANIWNNKRKKPTVQIGLNPIGQMLKKSANLSMQRFEKNKENSE